ncbi:hypothetical protein KAI58_00565 [Candidatus Gracilibacteria bacterium]|nr:hypothetical protein [Candidatus Gracilibacteria bacterium]
MTRILIVFALILGALFWLFNDEEVSMDNKVVAEEKEEVVVEDEGEEVEEEEKEEVVAEDEGEEVEEEVVAEDESEEVEEEVIAEEKSEESTTLSTPVVAPVVKTTENSPVVIKTVYSNKITDTKVFLYEWGIDLSSKEMPTGKVVFTVVNNGKFTHGFVINGVQNYGKVLPGSIQEFTAYLNPGSFEIYSDRRDDYEKGMRETFVITR